MNITFIASEFSQRLGVGTTYLLNSNYSTSGTDGEKTKNENKLQINADERRLIILTIQEK
jgi:hypothetical protein